MDGLVAPYYAAELLTMLVKRGHMLARQQPAPCPARPPRLLMGAKAKVTRATGDVDGSSSVAHYYPALGDVLMCHESVMPLQYVV